MESFEWDEQKNQENIGKHGVSFVEAQETFKDAKRVIYEDLEHSTFEEIRYKCIGKIGHRVCTVRFTYRGDKIRIFGAGFWRRKRNYMNEKINIGDIVEGTHGKMRRVADFLPRPEDLVLKKAEAPKAKKVTIILDDFTIDFFKGKAQELGASYQAMIRKLLLEYARKNNADEHNLRTNQAQ